MNSLGMFRLDRSLRRASSLLEVMVALVLLAIVLSALVANMASLTQSRDFAAEQEQANLIIRDLVEKVQSCPIDLLGTDGHWSEAQWISDDAGNPIGGLTVEQLHQRGITDQPIHLEDLEVFIEYFRGVDLEEGGVVVAEGMMQRDGEPREDYEQRISRHVLDDGAVFRYRLDEEVDGGRALAVRQQVALDPIVVRIIVRWGPVGERRLDVFTARRPEGST